jgi:hypothetical protein
MKARSLILGVFCALCLVFSTSGAQAQERPAHCALLDIMGNQEASDYLISQALQDMGFSPYRGPGGRVMEHSQRMVGWVFYLYSRGDEQWTNDANAYTTLQRYVRGVINTYDGNVPGLVRDELPIFDRGAEACGTHPA